MEKLENLQLLAKKTLRRRSRFLVKYWQGKEGFEFSDYRNYSRGDDLRNVDWNIYQRLGELVVREYDAELPTHLVLALDVSPSMGFYGKFSHACQLAAAFAYIGLCLLDRVTLITYPMKKTPSFVTYKGKQKIRNLLHDISCLKPDQEGDTKATFQQIRPLLPRRSSIIILGDFYDPNYPSTLPLLKIPGRSCNIVQVTAPEEYHPSLQGDLLLEDSEKEEQQLLQVDSERVALYEKQFRHHLAQLKSFCLRKKIVYTTSNSSEDITCVLSLLRQTGVLR